MNEKTTAEEKEVTENSDPSKPYRKDIKYKMVAADHKKMFMRGGALFAGIVTLAFIFPSPFVAPYDIARIAKTDPMLISRTIVGEFGRTSDTATYFNSINPYTYDTREAYVDTPYRKYVASMGGFDVLADFSSKSAEVQKSFIDEAKQYFENPLSVGVTQVKLNPVITAVSALTSMATSALYEAVINQEDLNSNPTRSLRFLSDTGVMDIEALRVNMATEQWGMAREETPPELTHVPPGAWWFAPIGMLNSTVLANDPNGDRDAAIILGIVMLIFITFPYIPYLNRLSEKLNLAPFIWKDHSKKEE